MKVIIPMAGRGTRLRPHTLITPKPLLPVAGKPIVQRLVEDIVAIYDGKVEEVAYIVGQFGAEVEAQLVAVAETLGAKGTIYYQDKPLGTAHAIWQARESMGGEVIIAFADTLFQADFSIDRSKDGAIWVKKVADPRPYGVVKFNEAGIITDFVEKPQEFVSDLAIIGIYYIRDSDALLREIQYLLDNDIRDKGEYQLTNALEMLKVKGAEFLPGEVNVWMDCGNKEAVLDTNMQVLGFEAEAGHILVDPSAVLTDAVIVPPCAIAAGAVIERSVVGPFVSVGEGAVIRDSVVRNSIIRDKTLVSQAVLDNAMLGMNAEWRGQASSPSLGDFSKA